MASIKKIEVSTAIYWVEIPEAELYVLCGCPGDSVKHLMKRGLIVPEEVQGVMTETGPNAILLSDSLVQEGAFANLAEFPVLQMLYRQGMILPGHPKNTGTKPLLIGTEFQVQAQLRYIHRGNYGLTDVQELMQAGMSRERAEEEMRLKLRFAFGAIKEPDAFLDTISLGDRPVEIRGGVQVKRLGHNLFEFRHKDESVQVDLNLPKGLSYVSPYSLGHQNLGRDYFSVVHSGNGDGWDVNRPAMASILMYQGEIYLIDAGANLQYTLHALGIGVNEIKGIFHTHAHDDHFCGLTTLMQADHRILHLATPVVRASVARKWAALLSRPETEFGKYFECVNLKEGRWNDVGGLRVKPLFSPHPLETTIMYFQARGPEGYKTYAHLADITSRRVMESFLEDGPSPAGLTQERFDSVWKGYLAHADVKKVDIGGGLIHGEAVDFLEDKSGKIILSHTALPLTNRQKEIGSDASFGMADVLIEGKQDFVRSKAFHSLADYLPEAKNHELRMLMNGDMIRFNPGDIILRRGEVPSDIYLVVTGMLELLDSDIDIANHLGAGGMVGDVASLARQPSKTTYRAMTHVRALRLPRSQLVGVMRKGGRAARMERRREAREFLEETWVFDGLSAAVQNRIAKSMITATYAPGDIIDHEAAPAVFLLGKGSVDIRFGEKTLHTLKPGEFLGEGFVIFETPCITTGYALEPTTMFVVPADVVADIPVVRWKLFETFRARISAIVESVPAGEDIFNWSGEFSTGVEKQDQDHKEILEYAAKVHRVLREQGTDAELDAALEEFQACAAAHFKRETAWYARERFPELEHHEHLHANLLRDMRRKVSRIRSDCPTPDVEFEMFFKVWLIDHILTEDRKFGALMALRKAKGEQA